MERLPQGGLSCSCEALRNSKALPVRRDVRVLKGSRTFTQPVTRRPFPSDADPVKFPGRADRVSFQDVDAHAVFVDVDLDQRLAIDDGALVEELIAPERSSMRCKSARSSLVLNQPSPSSSLSRRWNLLVGAVLPHHLRSTLQRNRHSPDDPDRKCARHRIPACHRHEPRRASNDASRNPATVTVLNFLMITPPYP